MKKTIATLIATAAVMGLSACSDSPLAPESVLVGTQNGVLVGTQNSVLVGTQNSVLVGTQNSVLVGTQN